MTEKKERNIIPSEGNVFNDLSNYFKLIGRLILDRRVNPFLKALPIGTLIYLLFPDIAPGPVDDAVVIWLGTFLFVELCPPDVVQEHRDALEKGSRGDLTSQQDQGTGVEEEDRIIDAEFWEKE